MRIPRRTVAVCLAIVVALMLTLIACDGTPAAEKIKIGLIVPLGDVTGDEGRKGALLAAEQINDAGGILGRQLEVIVVDDEMTPDKGAAAVDKLATVDKVDVFISGAFSTVHMAQIPRLKIYEKVTLVTGAAASACEEAVGGDADWYFHLFPWDYMQAQDYVMNWMGLLGAYPAVNSTKFFIAYEEGDFGSSIFFLSQMMFGNWTDVEGESFKSAAFGGGDYSAVLGHAKTADPDIFLWVGYAQDALGIMQQAKMIDFAPPLFAGSPPGWPIGFGDSPLSEAVMLSEVWTKALTEVSDVAKNFYDAYVAKWDVEPTNVCAPLLYSAVNIIAEGIERAGTVDTTPLVAALAETEYETPMMKVIDFSPSKIIQHQAKLTPYMCQWQSGTVQVVYPLADATATLIYPFPEWE